MAKGGGRRFWEVDAARGLAVVGMVLFHLAFDIDYLGISTIDVRSGPWLLLAQATASAFVILAGVSLSISSSRSGERGLQRKLLSRGLKIFSIGLLITLVTYIVVGEGFIVFGVLHLIGLSIILARPFLNLGILNLPLGAALVLAGLCIQDMTLETPWLIWLGLAPRDFYTLDYFPLLPWFGVVLLGIFAGGVLYPGGSRRLHLKKHPISWPLELMGRNSLPIYLAHQPLMIGAIYLLGMVPSVPSGGIPS